MSPNPHKLSYARYDRKRTHAIHVSPRVFNVHALFDINVPLFKSSAYFEPTDTIEPVSPVCPVKVYVIGGVESTIVVPMTKDDGSEPDTISSANILEVLNGSSGTAGLCD